MRSPDQFGPDHIREYEAYLFRERKLAARTVRQPAALRSFFIQTIKKVWSVADGRVRLLGSAAMFAQSGSRGADLRPSARLRLDTPAAAQRLVERNQVANDSGLALGQLLLG